MQTCDFPYGFGVCIDANSSPLVRGQVYRINGTRRDGFLRGVFADVDDLGGWSLDRFRPATPAEIDAAFPPELPFAAPSAGNDPAPSGLPDGNPKTRFGVAKPPIALIPGPALIHMADAFRDGAKKYGPANWRNDPVTTSTYVNAALRHILAYYDGETNASDSGVHHLGHAAGCLAILLDAEAQGTLNDDRPTPGRTSELIAEKTTPLS